ncbi:MAG TPA: hypothetical protein VFJ16_20190 [Longimicrobium sp.]|nr:hypothetical protein [Longimicrobium sp.]
MGLFDRNDYGRDYRGGGRSLGDRMRGAWNRFEERMGGGHPGYDRDLHAGYDNSRGRQGYGASGGGWFGGSGNREGGYGPASFAYRGLDDAWGTARNRGAHDTQWDWRAAGGNRYDQDTGPRRGFMGQERGGRSGYDRGFVGGQGAGYDRGFGSRGGYDRDLGRDRMRTDAGDPFGDRQGRTPFRVLRGGFDTDETDRGGWYQGNQLNQMSGGDPNDVDARGWNHGIGDDPVYRPEDFRGRDRGRGRRGPF